MNTNEAERKVWNKCGGWMGWAGSQKEVDSLTKERNEIIEILQQGEIYRQMIQKMRWNKYGAYVSLPDKSFEDLSGFVIDVEKEITGE